MCKCTPEIRTPWCGRLNCEPPKQLDARSSIDEYYMGIAGMVADRSNCRKRSVGCIIVRDSVIVSTGYNGTPRGFQNCFAGGCPRCASASGGEDYGKCFCCHAEENAIVQAARAGVSVNGGIMYCLLSPCLPCARMIVNAGIKRVFYMELWDLGDTASELLKLCGVTMQGVFCAGKIRDENL
jgi:dCMP deaminase